MDKAKKERVDFDRLWNYSKPDETEVSFRELLVDVGDDRIYHLELLTQIARTEGLQRKFDEAHRTLDEAEKMLLEEDIRPRVRYLLERGRVFNSAGSPERARPLFLEAWELASGGGEDGYAVDAAHMLGIVEPPEEALKWNEKALEIAVASSRPEAARWAGALYNNIGWTYHDMGKYPEALHYFQEGWKWRREQGQEREIRIAKWAVARCLRSLGRVDEALQMQRELLTEWDEAGGADGYVFEEIAECLLEQGKSEEAAGYFAQAYAQLVQDKWLKANEQKRLQRLAELGNVTPA